MHWMEKVAIFEVGLVLHAPVAVNKALDHTIAAATEDVGLAATGFGEDEGTVDREPIPGATDCTLKCEATVSDIHP